ncbi:MAG: GAF and ANTAR domain-containing protein [Nocardioidaceae bacterium]
MGEEQAAVPVDPETSAVFSGLADVIYVSDDFEQMYAAIVDAAPRLVEGCDHASLMLRQSSRFVTIASSDDVGSTVDAYERELGEGPCLDAIIDESVFHDADLTDGSPWPRLTERVLAQTPVRSMAGFRLRAGDGKAGALNLFSDTPGGLTERAVDQGIVLAAFVTVALVAAHERHAARTLRDGLASNREIGKAMGLMMAFHKVSDEEAFAMLRKASQDMNLKLVEVARQVVDHHNQV